MAKQGENREEVKEVKRLYRVWSQVDGRIELPAGLTARALLPKLDKIEQPVSPIGKIRFSPKVFTWQSGVTYAAAFALIVLLSSVLTRGEPPVDMLSGEIAATAPAVITEAAPAAAPRALPDPVIEEATSATVMEEPAAEPEDGVLIAGIAEAQDADIGAEEEALAIGGQSAATLLGTDETYSYLWRKNDPTDPDKEGYPVTVSIVDTASGELAAVIDLPLMQTVEDYYLYHDIIAFTGMGDNSAVLYAADLSDMENPTEYLELSAPGAFADSGLFDSTLHLLTVTETAGSLDCEIIPLPHSESAACCVVTAVDLSTGETASKAFSGVDGGEIYLYNLHAYMSYDGEPTEENETGKYIAQIRLDGLNIELTGEEDPPEASDATEPQPE